MKAKSNLPALLTAFLSLAGSSVLAQEGFEMPPAAPPAQQGEVLPIPHSGWHRPISPTAALKAGELQAALEPDTAGLSPQAVVPAAANTQIAALPVQQAQTTPILYIYEFSASWCPSCRKLEPLVEKTTSKYSGFAQLIPVNVDKNQELTKNLNVAQIPTVMIVDRNGRLLNRLVGLQQGEQLEQILDHYKKQSMASVGSGPQ